MYVPRARVSSASSISAHVPAPLVFHHSVKFAIEIVPLSSISSTPSASCSCSWDRSIPTFRNIQPSSPTSTSIPSSAKSSLTSSRWDIAASSAVASDIARGRWSSPVTAAAPRAAPLVRPRGAFFGSTSPIPGSRGSGAPRRRCLFGGAYSRSLLRRCPVRAVHVCCVTHAPTGPARGLKASEFTPLKPWLDRLSELQSRTSTIARLILHRPAGARIANQLLHSQPATPQKSSSVGTQGGGFACVGGWLAVRLVFQACHCPARRSQQPVGKLAAAVCGRRLGATSRTVDRSSHGPCKGRLFKGAVG